MALFSLNSMCGQLPLFCCSSSDYKPQHNEAEHSAGRNMIKFSAGLAASTTQHEKTLQSPCNVLFKPRLTRT
jgi:hypothetical protein